MKFRLNHRFGQLGAAVGDSQCEGGQAARFPVKGESVAFSEQLLHHLLELLARRSFRGVRHGFYIELGSRKPGWSCNLADVDVIGVGDQVVQRRVMADEVRTPNLHGPVRYLGAGANDRHLKRGCIRRRRGSCGPG